MVSIGKDYSADDILKHDMKDKNLAMLLSEITYIPELPVPIGILYQEDKPTYEQMMEEQIQEAATMTAYDAPVEEVEKYIKEIK